MTVTSAGLVSIIIPTFNHGAWICDAVDSALRQTWPHREIIVVDDGSTDGTGAIIRDRYDGAVRYVYQQNRGLSAARNAGLALAAGEFVQFLDADDILLPGKLAAHVAALNTHPECSVVYSDFMWIDGDQPDIRRPSGFAGRYMSGDVLIALLDDNFIVVHAAMCRRADIQAVGGFDESLIACEDYDLWLRMAAAGRLFLHTPDALVLYRRVAGSMSSSGPAQVESTIRAIERAAATLPAGTEARDHCRIRLASLHELMVKSLAVDAGVLFRSGRFRRAAVQLVRSATHDLEATARVLLQMAGRGARGPLSPTHRHGSSGSAS